VADDKNRGLSPEEIEFQDQIADETTPESMTRALRRRTSMLGNASTRERQRLLDLEKHRQTVSDVDARYGRAVSGNPLPTDDMSPDALKRDQDIKRHNLTKINEMQNEFSAGGYWENYRRERAAADLIKSTNTFVGGRSTGEQIYRASRSVSSLGAITKEAGGQTSTQLEKQVLVEKSRLAEQQEEIRTMATAGLNSPADEEAYRQAGIHHQESVNRLGVLTGAQTRQGRNKTDLMGRQRSIESLVAGVGKDSLKREVASEIASGGVGSMGEETLNLENIQNKILKAAEAFEAALDVSSEAAEDLGKDLDDLGEKYDKQKEIIGQLGKAGGGAPTISDKIARWSGTAADIMQAGSVGLKTMGVDQELRDIANKTGYAAISNRQFQDRQAALSGDMSAFRRMNTGQYAESAKKANLLGVVSATALGLSGGADALAITSEIMGKSASLNTYLNAGDVANKSTSNVAQRGMSTLVKGADVLRGITYGEDAIKTFNLDMAREDEINRARDISTQAYRDTIGGNALATRGAGSGRSALFDQMDDPKQRMALADLGMGTEQMQSIYAQGIAEMGADFRDTDAAEMVKRAAELQKSGLMGADQYMSSMGQLSTVGGGAGNMETIMKNAVANGMDSSRNIQQMVTGIASISSDSAMMGISTAAGATNVMGLALDTQSLKSLPENMRVAAAANQIGKMSSSMSDSSMNLFNVAESFALRAAFPEASDAQIARMQMLKPDELAEMRANPESAKKFGLDIVNNTKGGIDTLAKINVKAEVNSQAGLLVSEEARARLNDVIDRKTTWKQFTEDYPKESQSIIAAGGVHGTNSNISMPFLTKLASGEKINQKDWDIDKPDKVSLVENILATQFAAMEKINKHGQDVLEEFYGGIKGLNEKMSRDLTELDPKKADERAKKAGEGSLQVEGFDGSVDKFSSAVTEFVEGLKGKIGLGSGESSQVNMLKKRLKTIPNGPLDDLRKSVED